MRKLSTNFLECLKTGFLSGITNVVKNDPDLNLEIRENYCNIYYKGNSLLQLTETGTLRYKAKIHPKFLGGLNLALDFTPETVALFLNSVPFLKQNIINYGKRSLEVEYEQMIIRANNFALRSNSEYFIVDRQYTVSDGRFDLTGIFWEAKGRKRNQEVPICLMEIKFALNTDIREVHNQLARYYASIQGNCAAFAEEMETLFRQKLELGLYHPDRIEAMKTLTFSREIEKFQFIMIFVDYNHNSSLLDLKSLASLPFANQIKVFYSGFAMWQQNVQPLANYLAKES